MSDQSIDVQYIANLANIKLTDQEVEKFTSDLNKILEYMAQLQKFDVSDTAPMYHPLPLYDVMRKDEAREGLSLEDIMPLAPAEADNQIQVPKVVESA